MLQIKSPTVFSISDLHWNWFWIKVNSRKENLSKKKFDDAKINKATLAKKKKKKKKKLTFELMLWWKNDVCKTFTH